MSEVITVEDMTREGIVETPSTEVIIYEGTSGPQGPPGPEGPQGPPGVSGDKHYEQVFTSAASVTVNHNLGKYPAVTVIDSANDEVEGDVEHVSINQLIISFGAAFSGKVLCN